MTVAFRPFDTSIKQDLEAGKTLQAGTKWSQWLNWGIALAAIVIFLLVLRSFNKPVEGVFSVSQAAVEEPEVPSVELPLADPEVLEKLRQRDEIRK